MKLLRIECEGFPLFDGKIEVDLFASSRVSDENKERMSDLYVSDILSVYQNNVNAFIGINASGKTSILKVVCFALSFLNAEPISSFAHPEIFDGVDQLKLTCYFLSEHELYRLESLLRKRDGKMVVESETLSSKPLKGLQSKKLLFDFAKAKKVGERDDGGSYLLEDLSIMVAFFKTRKESLIAKDMLDSTNANTLSLNRDCPLELISFFDPHIEYLHVNEAMGKKDYRLKFFGKEEIALYSPEDLNRYLSSGTVKGINLFNQAISLFERGGYLVIDELENHFNQEIVATLLRFFMDRNINKAGAVLLFSTHYAQILDRFDRNDSIYIVTNREKIRVEKLSTLLKRTDVKKSDAYKSGLVGATAPTYDSYIALKRKLLAKRS